MSNTLIPPPGGGGETSNPRIGMLLQFAPTQLRPHSHMPAIPNSGVSKKARRVV